MLQVSEEKPLEDGVEASGRARATAFRIEVVAGLLWSGTLSVLEMGPALAKKAFGASDLEVALLTSGHSLGLMLSFLTTYLAARHSSVRLVFWLQLVSNLALAAVFFLRPSFALWFVALHAIARIAQSMAIPARVLVYRSNFPATLRGQLVGRLGQLQFVLMAMFASILSVLLDWNIGTEELVAVLGPCPVPADQMVRYAVPALAAVGLVGCFAYRRLVEASDGSAAPAPPSSPLATLREFARVWREDRAFRRYETFFFIFGFANIMSIPLTQIHAVDRLHASYFDLAMVNVVLVQGLMAVSMVTWGRRLDRSNPSRLRGFLNLILALDFLFLTVAPSIEWVYIGRIFRGLAMGGGQLLWMLGPLWFSRDRHRDSVYTGIHAVLTGIRWSLAPFAAVVLKAAFGSDSRPIFAIGFAILVWTGVAMLREGRERRTEAAPGLSP